MKLPRILLAAVLACTTAGLNAMSIRPPSLERLVSRAEAVVRTEVLETRCEERGEGATRRIVTLVKVKVEKVLAGEAPAVMELEMLGGQIGTRSLRIPGLTTFSKGDRDILFIANNGKSICPLVAANHGRYLLVQQGAGKKETVARVDNTPLRTIAGIKAPLCASGETPEQHELHEDHEDADSGADAMTADDFESAILECAKNKSADATR